MTVGSVMRLYRKRTFATSPRNAPEALMNLPPKEGVGNAGCPLHPRPRVHLVLVERTRVTTSTPDSPDVPARHHVARLTLPRPPHPHPASVTIAIRPSRGVGCEKI